MTPPRWPCFDTAAGDAGRRHARRLPDCADVSATFDVAAHDQLHRGKHLRSRSTYLGEQPRVGCSRKPSTCAFSGCRRWSAQVRDWLEHRGPARSHRSWTSQLAAHAVVAAVEASSRCEQDRDCTSGSPLPGELARQDVPSLPAGSCGSAWSTAARVAPSRGRWPAEQMRAQRGPRRRGRDRVATPRRSRGAC